MHTGLCLAICERSTYQPAPPPRLPTQPIRSGGKCGALSFVSIIFKIYDPAISRASAVSLGLELQPQVPASFYVTDREKSTATNKKQHTSTSSHYYCRHSPQPFSSPVSNGPLIASSSDEINRLFPSTAVLSPILLKCIYTSPWR